MKIHEKMKCFCKVLTQDAVVYTAYTHLVGNSVVQDNFRPDACSQDFAERTFAPIRSSSYAAGAPLVNNLVIRLHILHNRSSCWTIRIYTVGYDFSPALLQAVRSPLKLLFVCHSDNIAMEMLCRCLTKAAFSRNVVH